MSINPEWEAANEMARLIQYPSALAVEKFRGGMTLLRVVIPEKSVLNGMSVAEFAVKISRQILVCIVKRGKEIRIPDGNFVLMAGDAISVSLPIREATPFFKKDRCTGEPNQIRHGSRRRNDFFLSCKNPSGYRSGSKDH